MKNEQFKVLIVDDVPKNIMVLGNNLMSENYQIAYARSGQEAIQLSQSNDFDLILLDIMMPGLDGYETCQRILANPKTAKIPIIFITAKNDYESVVRGFNAGAKDYVTKPFNAKELLARVRTHLELKRNRENIETLNEKLEQKVKERTLELQKANEKITRLDGAKSSFLGIISHEIRTPLNGIFGSIEMMKDVHSDEETADILSMMEESANRLLAFSELSTLITELNINHYKLDKYMIDLADLLAPTAHQHISGLDLSHSVRINLPQENKGFYVDVDEKLIQKVISDILHNSIRFNDHEVEIDISLNQSDEHIELRIEDNGVGFPHHILPNLFQVFHADSKDYVEGKGLNLAAAKLIIDAHGGNITAQNIPMGGASILISFPKSTMKNL